MNHEDRPAAEPTGYANFQCSLTARQQMDIQAFLRELPLVAQSSETWKLLWRMSYTYDWSSEPRYPSPAHSIR